MSDRLDLPEHYRELVEAILRDKMPNAEVWAYGSRVDGTSYDTSDLDLVVRSAGTEANFSRGDAGTQRGFQRFQYPGLC